MCLAQGPQCSDAGEARTHGSSVSSEALYHWAIALPIKKCKGPNTVHCGTSKITAPWEDLHIYDIYEHYKFYAQFGWARKPFYNLGTWSMSHRKWACCGNSNSQNVALVEDYVLWTTLVHVFHSFVVICCLFSKFIFSKNSFKNTMRVSNHLIQFRTDILYRS